MLMFILTISCLTMSNLSLFMNLTFQVPIQYCSLPQQILFSSPDTSTWVSFLLWPSCFTLSGAISSSPLLFPSSILDTFRYGRLFFQCHIFLSFCTVHEVLRVSILGCFAIPFSSGPHGGKSELSLMTRLSWVVLHGMANSFTELDKAVVHVISLISFLWLWFSFCLPSDG